MANLTINMDEEMLKKLVSIAEMNDKTLEYTINKALSEYVVTEDFLQTEVNSSERSYFLSLGR